MSQLAPVALLAFPLPLMVGSPVHIPPVGLGLLGPVGLGGVSRCTEHRWLVADGTGRE